VSDAASRARLATKGSAASAASIERSMPIDL